MGDVGRRPPLVLAAGAGISRPAQVLPFPAVVPRCAVRLRSRHAARSTNAVPAVPRSQTSPLYGRGTHQRNGELYDGNPQGALTRTRAPAVPRPEVNPFHAGVPRNSGLRRNHRRTLLAGPRPIVEDVT